METGALDAGTRGLRVLAAVCLGHRCCEVQIPAFQDYVELLSGVPIVKLVPDVAFVPVLEVPPHPHSNLGACSNPHPPTGYTSLVHECEV